MIRQTEKTSLTTKSVNTSHRGDRNKLNRTLTDLENYITVHIMKCHFTSKLAGADMKQRDLKLHIWTNLSPLNLTWISHGSPLLGNCQRLGSGWLLEKCVMRRNFFKKMVWEFLCSRIIVKGQKTGGCLVSELEKVTQMSYEMGNKKCLVKSISPDVCCHGSEELSVNEKQGSHGFSPSITEWKGNDSFQ